MTINIAIAVAEGLAMAADSLSQLAVSVDQITVHRSVEKITEIRGKPVALMVNGIAELNRRTIISLIREFEFRSYNDPGSPIRDWNISQLSSSLHAFMADRYKEAYNGRVAEPPHLGIIVGGYSPGQPFPEVVSISYPENSISRVLPTGNGDPVGDDFIDFWGMTGAIRRVVFGYDAESIYDAVEILRVIHDLRRHPRKRHKGLSFDDLPAEYQQLPPPPPRLLDSLRSTEFLTRMNHRLRGMPLQEAVEFADFLGNVAVGFDRFCMGTAGVGGDLDVVAVQADGLHWYRRKPFLRDMARARERALDADDRDRMRTQVSSLLTNIAQARIQSGTGPRDAED